MIGPLRPYILQVWLTRLPQTTLDEYPLLNMALAIAMIFTNVVEMKPISISMVSQVNLLLVKAERGFKAAGETGHLGQSYAFRALLFRLQGEVMAGVSRARAALDLLPPIRVKLAQHLPIHAGLRRRK